MTTILPVQELHVYDLCAKYLARDTTDGRHSYFGHLQGNPRARFPEGWRFPAVEPFYDKDDEQAILNWNTVTFIYPVERSVPHPLSVQVIGDFDALNDPLLLQRVGNSRYWSVTAQLPSRRVYRYVFLVDGQPVPDPVNPRSATDPAKAEWSLFWTDYCQRPVTFEMWESILLQRLTRHILPFNSRESRIFLQNLDPSKLGASRGRLYRLDLAMGVVNYIDKLVGGQELHHRASYKTCLEIINGIIRQRNPFQEPRDMPEEMYVGLYDEMASGNVVGWDLSRYGNPSYFLRLLRRHTFMGAFSHPKYGGNAGAFGWDYLQEAFPPFDWRLALEKPWGTNAEYRG